MNGGSDGIRRHRLDVRGRVQGVGFRPFVHRLAREMGLGGYVANTACGALIEITGTPEKLTAFESALLSRLPPLAQVRECRVQELNEPGAAAAGTTSDGTTDAPAFEIRPSRAGQAGRAEVTPDAATCDDCRRELFDPADRRYRYPFINCTNCGPRYSIVHGVPYDRPRTSMAGFRLCPPCAAEYADPRDRRFHAQPNACTACGPRLSLLRADRTAIAGDPIRKAAELLKSGAILALKGVGGYHLACRADDEDTVQRLRRLKLRDGKPLAVMASGLDVARALCRLTDDEVRALGSAAAPIVLARKTESSALAPSVAPCCPNHGIMLSYAPVHHLLFAEGLGPLVMTSANRSGCPLTYEDEDAFRELSDVADAFLVHDRAIVRPLDDSVVFVYRGGAVPLRRARGYVPIPMRLARPAPLPILAVGGELKSTVCLYAGRDAILSEHLGDLTRPEAYRHFLRAIQRIGELFGFTPRAVAYDLHPRYLSTQYAQSLDLPTVGVQHHHAHLAAVMAEWETEGPVIGICCDGVGYGTDGAMWGCELLHCTPGSFERSGHLDYFPLIGGDAAARETWRPAAALLRQAHGEDWPRCRPAPFDGLLPAQLDALEKLFQSPRPHPLTSSLGRVFDAVSFMLGLCTRNRHEAEAALALEAAATDGPAEPYPYATTLTDHTVRMSLLPAVSAIVREVQDGRDAGVIAARFHETVARMLSSAALMVCEMTGVRIAAVSGGCFANRRLLNRVVERLESRHLKVLYPRRVPCGDGGIALGQAVAAAAILRASGRVG